MEIFGIGPMELILILIVALMVFGPDRLPTIGSKLGRAVRDMRRATRAISEEISTTRAAIEAPAKELAQPFQDVANAAKTAGSVAATVRNPSEAIRQSVLKELNAPAKTVEAAATPIEPENTIAPPDLIQGASSESNAALPSSDGVLALPDASPSAVADLPAAGNPTPDSTGVSEEEEENPQEAPHQDGDEQPPQPTDAAPRVPEQ